MGLFRHGWMKYLNYWVRWILNLPPPIATLSKAPTGIVILGFSQLLTRLRSWNFFLEDLQSVRVLMGMRVQKIWKKLIVERLSGQSASAEKNNTH